VIYEKGDILKKFFETLSAHSFAHQSRPVRIVLIVVGTLVIFTLGYAFGQGRISAPFSLTGNNSNLPSSLNYSSINQLYSLLKTQYDGKLSSNSLLDGLKSGLVNATGDPYTEYFNSTAATQLNNEINGSFSGIGAQLGKDSNNNLEVIAPISGTPAAKSGLQPKDLILSINNTNTQNLTIDQAVQLIRGPKGSQVNLTILLRHSKPLISLMILPY